MVQIKCPVCHVVTNLEERFFMDRSFDSVHDSSATFMCQSCGKHIPMAVYKSVRSLIIKENFDGWEIGTEFPKPTNQ